MNKDEILDSAYANGGQVANMKLMGIISLVGGGFIAFILLITISNMSRYDDRKNAMIAFLILAILLTCWGIGDISLANKLKQVKIVVYNGGIRGTSLRINYLIGSLSYSQNFDCEFSEITSVSSRYDLRICTRYGEYILPLERYKAQTIQKCIEDNMKQAE